MKISSGIIIKYKDKILLCHPTNSSWNGTFSFPKGLVNDEEDLIDAAIRECFEETGIIVSKNNIINKFCVKYTKGRTLYKKVYLFQINIESLEEIGLTQEVVDKDKLQLEEIDWCGFVNKNEIENKIFWRFKNIINDVF